MTFFLAFYESVSELVTQLFTLRSDLLTAPDGDDKRTPTPFQRSVGVQTDYRESETQTDPYTPDHVIHPGTASPELLTLATLTWGKPHKYNIVTFI